MFVCIGFLQTYLEMSVTHFSFSSNPLYQGCCVPEVLSLNILPFSQLVPFCVPELQPNKQPEVKTWWKKQSENGDFQGQPWEMKRQCGTSDGGGFGCFILLPHTATQGSRRQPCPPPLVFAKVTAVLSLQSEKAKADRSGQLDRVTYLQMNSSLTQVCLRPVLAVGLSIVCRSRCRCVEASTQPQIPFLSLPYFFIF